MTNKTDWESVHVTRPIDPIGWYQAEPTESIALIRQSAFRKSAHIIDIGAGTSSLAGFLLNDRFTNITVLDISATAILRTQARLGDLARRITWIEADVTLAALPVVQYDIWHDRSVFHYFTAREDRQQYVETVTNSLKPGGHLILATPSTTGPTQCNGLDVMRYTPKDLQREFSVAFDLIESCPESNQIATNKRKNFIYCHFRKL